MIIANLDSPRDVGDIIGILVMALGLSSFLWIPLVLAAYTLGRRQFGTAWLLIFAAAETLAIFAAILICSRIHELLP
jgi:hypothetical protein